MGTLLEDHCTFIIMCRLILVRVKHTFYIQDFFSFENRAVYGIMWKDITQPGSSQMTKI